MVIDTSSITSKGQVTIPVLIRKKLALKPGERVSFLLEDDNKVRLIKAPDFFSFQGSIKTKKKYDPEKIKDAVGKNLAKRYDKSY